MKRIPIIVSGLLVPSAAFASEFGDFGRRTGLGGTEDPDTILFNVISTVLGLLALLAVIMVIVGGFRWMLSMGNEERILKAKQTISGAIVGLIIVLISWAVVAFVLGVVQQATGAA